jgi:hypothetical protein
VTCRVPAAIGSSPSFTLSATLGKSNVTLATRGRLVHQFRIRQRLIQRLARLPMPLHQLMIERTLFAAASPPLDAAISLVSAVSLFWARLHTRNSRCV